MVQKILVSQYERPYFFTLQPPPPPPPPPPAAANLHSHGFNLNDKVSPSVLLIIIILAIIFFISGLLHLLVRFLLRPPNRDPDEFDNVTALQGQLQQLFHLHDSGVDQSFIDTLPVFTYKSIIGVKNHPFDCAVCLCEFEGEDKLRLLPKCSHAFHMDCIDTWLLSHSTCPLCRGSLLSDFNQDSCSFSPIVLVLESGSNESSREIVSEPNSSAIQRVNSHLSFVDGDQDPESDVCEIIKRKEEEKVVTIKLGKFKNVNGGGDGGGGGGGEKNRIDDSRRCFSMGSFEYVMDESLCLQVAICRAKVKKNASRAKCSLPITSSHRLAMSECGGDSRRDFNGIEGFRSVHFGGGGDGGGGGRSKRESFSVSKIWLRGKKEKPNSTAAAAAIGPSSRGSFSFRLPLHPSIARDELKGKTDGGGKRRAISEVDIGWWENEGGGGGGDQESQSLDLETPKTPSFARRTILWLMGRQQIKVVDHSSFSTNV